MGQISQRVIKTLRTPERGNRVEWDGEIPGFGVRITSAGVKSFVISYRFNGRKRRYTIGRCSEWSADAARDRAIELKKDIRNGKDPLQEKQKASTDPTMKELGSQYLERHAETHKRASGQRNDRQMLNGILLPRLGTLQVKAVGRRDIETLHASLKATPYRANRVLSLLSKMFSLAVEWGWRSDNPVRGIPRFHEDKRERWLTVDELRSLHVALDAYPDQKAANAIRLLIMTGAREGEVLKADWSQFDLKRGIWTKPSHHTKQKKIEHTPLGADVLKLLETMKPQATGPLFPGTNRKERGTNITARVTIRRPWVQVCKAAGLVEVLTLKGKRRTIKRYRPTLRIHDLRHTYASHLVSDGVSLQVVGKLLGHTNPQTTNRYAHVADEALRKATNRFGEILNSARKKNAARA